MIGNAKEFVGLYILKIDDFFEEQTQNESCISILALVSQSNRDSISVVSSNNDYTIMLWHYRFGHLDFLYLEKLFSLLFNNKNLKFFQ